jgi:hypothetical protein
LLVAMILGRAVHAALTMLLLGFQGWRFYLAIYLPGVPGMVALLIVIPPLALRIRKALKLPIAGEARAVTAQRNQ